MKKVSKIFGVVAAIAALASCNKEVPQNPETEVVPEGMVKISVSASQGTKTEMKNDGAIYWSAGDKIGIECEMPGIGTQVFELDIVEKEIDRNSAKFEGLIPADATAVGGNAYYPFINEDVASYNKVPEVQEYKNGTFATNVLPMMGLLEQDHSHGNFEVNFKATAAVVKLEKVTETGEQILSYKVNDTPKSVTMDLGTSAAEKNVIFVVEEGAHDFQFADHKYSTSTVVEAASRYVLGVCKIAGKGTFKTISEALIAAENDDVIEIYNGTWTATEVGKLDAPGVYTNANIVRYKSLTIQPAPNATAKFTANLSLGYDDSSTANATMTVKGLNFDGASLQLSNYVQATVEDCNFVNGTSATNGVLVIQDACCINHKTAEEYPTSQITITDCKIDGSNTGASGIRLRNSGNVIITGCEVKNSEFNGILFESNTSVDKTPEKAISITNNTITEWNVTNESGQGRAMRLALGTLAEGSTLTVTGNAFNKETLGLDTPDFFKATGCGNASNDLNGNYWANKPLSEVNGNTAVYTCDGNGAVITSVITK